MQVHPPSSHTFAPAIAAHDAPQAPQFWKLLLVSAHLPAQQVLRDGQPHLTERPQLFWTVPQTAPAHVTEGRSQHAERGVRKLLLHQKEIAHLERAVLREGYALVPLDLHFEDGRVKVTLGLGRGRKAHDKRAVLAAKTAEREAVQDVRAHRDKRARGSSRRRRA